MLQTINRFLAAHGAGAAVALRLSNCTVTRKYLLERAGITNGTVFLFPVPYYTTKCDDPTRNISAYAVSGDYHLFFSRLFDDILPMLREEFPNAKFAGFTDHSPIDEREAALRGGLGVIGRNHLLITKEYSSYVFLGEIITDAVLDVAPVTPGSCLDCGACLTACPAGLSPADCLSALTQKKGALTVEEEERIRKGGSLWGCDRCSEVCPMTKKARESGTLYSGIPYFHDTAIPHLDQKTIDAMDDDFFKSRAYSWRGREVILRNIRIFEEEKQ